MIENKKKLKDRVKNLQEQKDIFLNLSSCSLVLLAQLISIDENSTNNLFQDVIFFCI
jgi:hypothetical protein